MKTTRTLVGELKRRMEEQPDIVILSFLDKAYMRLVQNDIEDMIFYLCEPVAADDVIYPFPVLKRMVTIPPNGGPGGTFPMPACVPIIETNFEDNNGDPIEFKYHNEIITCRKVNYFFTESDIFYQFWNFDYQTVEPHTPQYNLRYLNNNTRTPNFVRIPASLRQADQISPAEARFFERPYDISVTTQTPPQIFISFWMQPPSLVTVNSKMLIDVDKWQDELTNGAVGYYELEVNGRSEMWERFIKFDRPRFMNEANSNIHNIVSQHYKIRSIG